MDDLIWVQLLGDAWDGEPWEHAVLTVTEQSLEG